MWRWIGVSTFCHTREWVASQNLNPEDTLWETWGIRGHMPLIREITSHSMRCGLVARQKLGSEGLGNRNPETWWLWWHYISLREYAPLRIELRSKICLRRLQASSIGYPQRTREKASRKFEKSWMDENSINFITSSLGVFIYLETSSKFCTFQGTTTWE